MSRLLLALLMAALIFPLVNCGGSAHAPDEKYFLVATNVKLPYWQQAGAGLTKAALQMKVQAEMVGPDTYDPKAEREQFQKALSKKPAGILISVADPALLKPDIDAAVAQGIPVIAIDSDAATSKRLMFVGTDNHKAGMMGAKVVADKLKGKGNIVIFTIPEQTNLVERLHGYKDVLDTYPGIKVIDTVDMKGDARIAFDTATEMLDKGTKADAFVCLEAIACAEVAEVLDRKKVTGKGVVAMDTDQRTLEAIQKGTVTATIGQKPYTMAFIGIKLADDLHHNPLAAGSKDWSQDSFSPIPTFVDTGATLIDKSNVEQFIQARNSATGQ
jgi:ribose transport system substrate-binding protein